MPSSSVTGIDPPALSSAVTHIGDNNVLVQSGIQATVNLAEYVGNMTLTIPAGTGMPPSLSQLTCVSGDALAVATDIPSLVTRASNNGNMSSMQSHDSNVVRFSQSVSDRDHCDYSRQQLFHTGIFGQQRGQLAAQLPVFQVSRQQSQLQVQHQRQQLQLNAVSLQQQQLCQVRRLQKPIQHQQVFQQASQQQQATQLQLMTKRPQQLFQAAQQKSCPALQPQPIQVPLL